MPSNGKNILGDLKDHEVQPPSFLLDQIMQKIEEGNDAAFKKVFAQLRDHSISPKKNLLTENIEPEIQLLKANPLKALKDHSIASPVQFEKVLSGVKETLPKAKVVSFAAYSRRIAAAVAVIILGGAAYFIYQNTKDSPLHNNNSVAVTTTPANNKSADPAIAAPQLNPPITPQNSNAITAAANPLRPGKKSEALPFPYTGGFAPTFSIDGSKFAVKDNDYLATFASFTEENMPGFLRAQKPVATTITVDKYTSINISEGMAAILKKTYKTRRNGKPTRRARKQKEKIEKWKRADADYFNQNSTNNPLDPMDLGDFILYK